MTHEHVRCDHPGRHGYTLSHERLRGVEHEMCETCRRPMPPLPEPAEETVYGMPRSQWDAYGQTGGPR